MKLKSFYPTVEEEKEIVRRMSKIGEIPSVQPVMNGEDILEARKIVNQIYIDEKVIDYILQLVFATRAPQDYGVDAERLLLYGASPRSSIALTIAGKARAFLSGRSFVTPNDIKEIAHDVLRHHLRRTYEAEAEDVSPDEILDRILTTIPVP